MSVCLPSRSLSRRFGVVLTSVFQQPGLPFAEALPAERIQAAFDEQEVDFFAADEDGIYTPAVRAAEIRQPKSAAEIRHPSFIGDSNQVVG